MSQHPRQSLYQNVYNAIKFFHSSETRLLQHCDNCKMQLQNEHACSCSGDVNGLPGTVQRAVKQPSAASLQAALCQGSHPLQQLCTHKKRLLLSQIWRHKQEYQTKNPCCSPKGGCKYRCCSAAVIATTIRPHLAPCVCCSPLQETPFHHRV